MTPSQSLRLVVIAPDLVDSDSDEPKVREHAERSRQLRIGLLENGYNIVAVLPADTFLGERLAQLAPDKIIVDAESEARSLSDLGRLTSENRPQRGQFLPDLQAHSPAMGQKDGEKWTAAVDFQPTLPKSDRLLETRLSMW